MFALSWLFTLAAGAQPPAADGPFTDARCIACHEEREPAMVKDWREGPHGGAAGAKCSDCHGSRHVASVARARRNQICRQCHQGPADHSYTTSKHGVILGLQGQAVDWSRALRRGHYRAPGCSYCHLHDRRHGDAMAAQADTGVKAWICTGCHSPRYVRKLFDNAERQQAITDLKAAEALGLLAAAKALLPEKRATLHKSLRGHLRNVRLGLGHQSPDYQWWLGQPALDGDLIRIRQHVDTARRRANLARRRAEK